MREVYGNLWDYLPSHAVVVTTNVGWKKDGRNPMGRGVALEAAQRFPELPFWYGSYCFDNEGDVGVVSWKPNRTESIEEIILFPTKPFNCHKPYLSWKSESSLELIEESTIQLARNWPREKSVVLPLPGCGNGGRKEEEVLPILRKYLVDDRFVLVRKS